MAEEEINYSSVVFKTKTHPRPKAQKEEETVYDEVKVPHKTAEQAADINAGFLPDEKATNRRPYCQLLACLGIFCVILLLGIITVSVYLSMYNHESELKQLKDNHTAQLAIIHNLTEENENLKGDNNNLTVLIGNLTQKYTVLESKNSDLTAKNQNLTAENQELKTQNQELKTQKNNLTEQLQNAETKWNEKSVAVAQQAIDAYCPLKNNRKCEPCEEGWVVNQPKCFAINNPEATKQKTWEEARENCRGKISDLTVIADAEEKRFISKNSWNTDGLKGYWIGLRVEDGKWKWINGSYLTESSWTERPTNGHCAMSVHNEGWKSVNCTEKNGWICEKKALSL